ncbi:MAG: tyrosine-type recombinase/integrase [Pseudomonadota bacterium]
MPAAGPELLERYIEVLTARGFAPRTVRQWRCDTRHFLRWVGLGRDLGALRKEDVRAYAESHRRFARPTQRQRLWVVVSLFDWLLSSGQVAANPASGIRCRTFFKRIPTESEMSRLLSAANRCTALGSRDRAIAELMYSAGAWSEEVCRLDCAEVDLDSGVARVRYRGKDRVLLLGGAACEALRDYLLHSRPRFAPEPAALFVARDGRRLTVRNIRTILRRLARKAGLEPVTPQQFRQACATHMLQAGAELGQVQQLLSHAHSGTLKKVHTLYHPRERIHESVPPAGDDELRPDSVLDSYIDACARRGPAPQTLDLLRSYLRQFLEWVGERDLGALTQEEVEAYSDELRARGVAREHRMWAVRDLFAWLHSRGLIAANPLSRTRPFPERIPAESEMKRLLSAVNTRTSVGRRDRAIAELMYSAGLRGEEVSRLDCADVDLDSGTVRVRYRGHERAAPVGEAARAALQDYLQRSRPGFVQTPEETALFLRSDQQARPGTRLTTHALKAILYRLSRKAGIDHPVSPRQFRYACATHMLNAGAGYAQVQQLLGHAPIGTTEMKKLHRLYHPRESERRRP